MHQIFYFIIIFLDRAKSKHANSYEIGGGTCTLNIVTPTMENWEQKLEINQIKIIWSIHNLSITYYNHRSCTEVVREIVQDRIKQGYPNPEEEKLDLQRMEQEAEELTMLAETLVKKVRSGYRARRSTQVRRVVSRASELGAVSSDVVIKVEDTEQVPPNTAERTESAASLREVLIILFLGGGGWVGKKRG